MEKAQKYLGRYPNGHSDCQTQTSILFIVRTLEMETQSPSQSIYINTFPH